MKQSILMAIACAVAVSAMTAPARAIAYDCPTVRAYVSQFGLRAAHRWARAQGYTIFEIAMVKAACFKR